MYRVTFDVPEEILIDLHEDKHIFEEYVRHRIAIDLYAERNVSLGYCAEFAGLSKEEFVRLLGKNNISVFAFESYDEFLQEMENA